MTATGRAVAVFISHAGPDSDFARWLAEGLGQVGITARLDQAEIRAGDNIVTWMNDAIGESDYLLVLLSPQTRDRYWVRMEWSSALMKEAHLRRAFVIPVLLPGLQESDIPDLLRAKAFLDFRADVDAAFLQLVSRLKDDELAQRELGRLPTPAPRNVVAHIEAHLPFDSTAIDVIVHSNRFGRSFRLRVPPTATPSYLMGMLRETLNLKFSNVDHDLGVELSYTYTLRHDGQALPLNQTLADSGVKDGDRLALWIRVTLRDLVEDKALGDQVFFHMYQAHLSAMTDELRRARKRAFSSSEIARIASQFFDHVDA